MGLAVYPEIMAHKKGILGLAAALSLLSLAASAQEFSTLEQAVGAFKFQAGKPAIPASAADATAAVAMSVVPSKSEYPVRGVDVSHYQGAIAWDKVKSSGLSFAYIKATEGDDLTDDDFLVNWQAAEKAGLRRGAYHFYDFCQAGAAQAAHFLKIVPAGAGDLPVAIDLEVSKSCKTLPTKTALRKSLKTFVAAVEKAYGKTPAIYVNNDFYTRYFQGENDAYPVWITDAKTAPALPDNRAWTFWQFSYKGQVAGIAGDVDMDVYNGPAQQFAKLENPETPAVMLADASR